MINDLPFEQRLKDASCRGCERLGLMPVLDLGLMPPSDGLLTADRLSEPEQKFRLDVGFCPDCSLVQILETVPPEFLFGERYLYFSSFSPTLLNHSRMNALELIARRELGRDSLVVELASNDGYLLKNFVEKGIPVLGIDPAKKQAEAARAIDVPTLNAFFSRELADNLVKARKRADVVIANNVLAHVADTHGFLDGIFTLLKDEGMAVIEVPYVRDLVDHCEFDTIYHEHLCYFSLTALDKLLRRHQMFVQDVRCLPIHGGSLRVYVTKDDVPGLRVKELLAEEARVGIDKFEYYHDFSLRVGQIREDLRSLLYGIKKAGKRIAAYGAAAKGTILLNYTGLDPSVIEYVVDRNPHKHGKFMPGVHLEILPTELLSADMPEYVLLLPWNFSEEILEQQAGYRRKDGKFIIPIPTVKVV